MKPKVAKNSKPIAVLISDVHYNLQTLEVADKAMRQAIHRAHDLGIPLVVAGDLHDTKANMRAECMNAMLKTFTATNSSIYILRGNHDQINEKSEEHSLNFLSKCAHIVDAVEYIPELEATLIPYQHDVIALRKVLQDIPTKGTIIMHQGITGSLHGEYIQDKTAITIDDVAGRRIISGHYHNRQTIKLPDGGVWDYIGNPYTLSFGEANDPPKGYQILREDGSLNFIPTYLREHKIMEVNVSELNTDLLFLGDDTDLLWVKISGPADKLATLTKSWIAQDLDIKQDFRLDLIPDDIDKNSISNDINASPGEVLDTYIDNQTMEGTRKERLKAMWKALIK